MSAEPTGKLARRLWPRPLCNTADKNNVWEKCSVYTHIHYTHQRRHLAQSRCCPQWVRECKKDETGRQLGWGGQPRWTDPVGKPQGGRHTTPAAYLLNVRFEWLSTLFIEATNQVIFYIFLLSILWKDQNQQCKILKNMYCLCMWLRFPLFHKPSLFKND